MIRLPGSRDLTSAHFLEGLAALLDAGLNPATALEQQGMRKFFPRHIDEASASVRAGGSLATAFALLRFDGAACTRVEAAEHSGRISAALRRLAAERARRGEWIQKAIGKLLYPIFIIHFAALARGIATAMQSGADDGLVAALWVAVPVDAALAAVALFFYYSGRGGTATVTAMRIPGIARLLRDASLVPFLWTLADLYESGVPIDQAVSGAARVSGVYYRAELEEVARAARAGRALVPELARTTLVDETTLAILQPAEVTGTLSDALVRAATLAEQRLASGLAVACRAPGAILYAVAVLIVATMVFKFYSNMYSVPDWFR